MNNVTLNVEGMSCDHCVKAVRSALSALGGIADVSVSLENKTVSFSHDPALLSLESVKAAITEEGYEII